MKDIESAEAFARRLHDGQRRKGAAAEPYVTHVAEVADLVARWGGDEAAVAAAWLHDTVEDCGVALGDLAGRFGDEVAGLVAELTDDKALPKAERKRMQVVGAPAKSPKAALVKIADKTSNVRAVADSPAVHWDAARRAAYLDWAEIVVSRLPAGADPGRAGFAEALERARAVLAGQAGS